MTRTVAVRVAWLLLALSLASACGGTGEETAMPENTSTPSASGEPTPDATTPPPLSSTVPPTRGPQKPPKTPSDLVPHDVLLGRVTRGGTGPCYGLMDDDGVEWAMYSAAGIELTEGQTVRVRYEPLLLKIYCGPGEHINATEITVLGT